MPSTRGQFAGIGTPEQKSQRPAPLLGEHTVEIAADRLGLRDEQIDDLVKRRVLQPLTPSTTAQRTKVTQQ